MSKKCTRLWHEARFKVQIAKHHKFGPVLQAQAWLCVAIAMAQWILFLLKSDPSLWVLNQFQRRWQAWTSKKICKDNQRCMSHPRHSTKDMSIRHVKRSGRWFPEKGLHFGASDLQACHDDFAS